MPFLRYTIDCAPESNELLIALLADAGFDSFEEREAGGIDAYAEAAGADRWVTAIRELQQRFPFTFSTSRLEDKNWNEVWESQFSPIQIGSELLIRASFHSPRPAVRREIVIDPKMAFGTGHHATTHMMCELLLERVGKLNGQRVLDYGSGTGVLAILAAQLGAGQVDAVDIELPSYESTLENAAANGVTLSEVVYGVLDDVPLGKPYDLVLANINRNVLLQTGGALYDRLRTGGVALMSGILAQDEDRIVEHMTSLGFLHRETRRSADWRAFEFTRG